MTEEIKEILEDLKNKDLSVDDLTHNDKAKLIDYITNLQEENEILKELNICVGCENNPDYKSRCEKTIEYIKSNYIDNPIEFKKELLSILGGDK